uniref:Diacylglycerol kinase n=1 Tax=Aureoumbra lagunensis TaxID=44058 RepID=A0A7S3NH12_9STRA
MNVLVFCNAKSGGGCGGQVLSAFQKELGAECVFDLGQIKPEDVLSSPEVLAKAKSGLRLIVCGGDGTMTWIMASIDAVKEKKGLDSKRYRVSIATMPLGTGNDLSRILGWGGKFRSACLKAKPWLEEVCSAETKRLDRWLACVMPSAEHQHDASGIPTIPEVFSVHEYDTKPLGGPRHELISRGLHYTESFARYSEEMLIQHDQEMRSMPSLNDRPFSEASDTGKKFDRNFLQVIEEDERRESINIDNQQNLEENDNEKKNEEDDFSDQGEEDASSAMSFDDRGRALIDSHVVPSESVLKNGSTWRSYDGTLSNYISFGVDAAGAYAFHSARRAHPKRFSSRLKNQLLYAWLGLQATGGCCGCDGPPPELPAVLELSLCDPNGQWTKIQLPQGCRGLIVLNLQSYAGGRDLWGHTSSFRKPNDADGLLELVTTTSIFDLATKLVTTNGFGGHARRLCQASEIRIRLTTTIHMQIDGEPWIQPPATVHIKAIGQADVLCRSSSAGCCAN